MNFIRFAVFYTVQFRPVYFIGDFGEGVGEVANGCRGVAYNSQLVSEYFILSFLVVGVVDINIRQCAFYGISFCNKSIT